jgi:hypothetical protein
MYDHTTLVAEMVTDLRSLTTDGGTDNRLIVQSAHAWLIYTGERGRSDLRCEAAPSGMLPADRKLRPADVHLLRQAGFASRPNARGLVRDYRLGDDAPDHHPTKVADDAVEILRSVYHMDLAATPPTRRIELADRDATANPNLIDAIRALSRQRDTPTRNSMYRQMLRARFFLPKNPDGRPTTFGDLQGATVYGVFTDSDALRWWNPLWPDREIVSGRSLFPMMARTGLGSLLINPGGRVGGELYRNEVQMLADTAR